MSIEIILLIVLLLLIVGVLPVCELPSAKADGFWSQA
jgi:hypothetical protein